MNNVIVLDTNVVLYDPLALFAFDGDDVIVPLTVVEEIDRFKKDQNVTGQNAREVSRIIDKFRSSGSLTEGVKLEGGGCFKIGIYRQEFMQKLPPELRADRGENRILALAKSLHEETQRSLILITKDTSLRIKADSIGLRAEDYEANIVSNEGDSIGSGSGGYIVLDLPNNKRSLFHDLLKGFEDFSRIKGYETFFSVDSTYIDKIAFKFTVNEDFEKIGKNQVRDDFKEYLDKLSNGESLDEMPVIASYEEHIMFITALKNRINFLQHSYKLSNNTIGYYERILEKLIDNSVSKSNTVLVQTGGSIDSSSYNSSNVIQGNENKIEDNSVFSSVVIGDSFKSKKEQIDKIDEFIAVLKNGTCPGLSSAAVIKDLEKVKDELQDEPEPDVKRVTKLLERTKQALQLGSLGQETISAAKNLFSVFGMS